MYHHKKSYISSRPTARRVARRRPQSQFWSNAKKIIITYKNSLLGVVIALLVFVIIHLVYAYTIGKPENTIQNVVFSEEVKATYKETALYGLIEQQVQGRNIVMLRLKNTGKVRRAVQEIYPIVKDVSFQKVSANTVSASVSFYPVDLIFANEAVTIGYSNKFLFSIHE